MRIIQQHGHEIRKMSAPKLNQAFYERETREVAKDLLGKKLVTVSTAGITSGRIVETEAYLPTNDSACHASKHRTARTEVMFGRAGHAYVYPIHAKHCFNVVTDDIGKGCAVLIRALEPLEGIELMQHRRQTVDPLKLTRGPACLCQALAIDRRYSGLDLTHSEMIWITDLESSSPTSIVNTVRIGVTSAKNRKLRYAFTDSRYVSGPRYLGR